MGVELGAAHRTAGGERAHALTALRAGIGTSFAHDFILISRGIIEKRFEARMKKSWGSPGSRMASLFWPTPNGLWRRRWPDDRHEAASHEISASCGLFV
jgi:hypothetical protein